MDEENPEGKSFTFKDKRRRFDEDGESSGEPEKEDAPAGSSDDIQAGPAPEKDLADGDASAPPINFSTFVLSLASSAAYHMGGFQDAVSGKTSVNLDLAKQSIDILAILEEKTKGNLTEEETSLLSHSLYDLRMKFVEMSKK